MNAQHHAQTARLVAPVILILLSLVVLVPANARRAAIDGDAAMHPIYIGQIVPLTGNLAAGPGAFEQAGPKLAVRQINEQGGIHGRPLQLVIADDQSTASGAIAAFERITRVDHVTAIIGPGQSSEIQAMTPYIEQASIPMMIGGTAPKTTRERNPWVFRTRPTALIEEKALTTFAVARLHLTRIAILHATDTGGRGAEAALLANLKALGTTPLTNQSFTEKTSDLTAQVLAIKRSGATALISEAAFAADFVLLGRQMHQIGMHLTWLGTPALGSPLTTRQGGALFYGSYAVTDYVPGQSPEAAAFDRASEASFHLPGDFASAYAYDGLQILTMVIRNVGTAPQAIRKGILAIRGYRGVEGTYNFEPNGDGLHQDTIVQNVQGRLRVVKVLVF